MSGLYLTGLADWLRAAGLPVHEWDGWQTRARGSGGFTGGRPWCVMWHHTASQSSIEGDGNYCAFGSDDAPICNIIVNPDGSVSVIAAGATNTNGKGRALTFSKGTVPADQMNTHAVGMEIANNGTGEPYPQVQIDAAFSASLVICGALWLQPDDVAQHWDYAPDRKIDPATADAVEGSWQPHAVTSSGTWSLDDLRGECLARAGLPAPIPPPIPDPSPIPITEDDMRITAALDRNGTIWIGNGIHRHALDSMDVFSNYVVLGNAGSIVFVNTSGDPVRELGNVAEVGDVTIEALGVPI